MEFRTKVDLPVGVPPIHHSDILMLWGSCFVENIGKLFSDYKFQCDINPFGILYNPYSIAKALSNVLTKKIFDETNLRKDQDVWYSMMHHGSFSSSDKGECLGKINGRLQNAINLLPQVRWMIFTWGTAWVYEWKETGEVVGNCHKLPSHCFTRRLLSVDEIVETYIKLIKEMMILNPQVHFLFTVSPIRHVKDGMHGNQVSKSVLLLAAQQLVEKFPCCFYFPSYEIMIDELRDYRFYAEDMLHPSQLAIDYMWECVGKVFFPPSTITFLNEWEKLKKGINHRPFDVNSNQYQRFLSQILLRIELLKEKFPYLDVQKEIEICRDRLKK